MKFKITNTFFLLAAFFTCFSLIAQEPQTIKFKKESNLVKAVFDNTDPKLFVVDRFGNPRDNKVLSYKLYIKAKRETKSFEGFSNALTGEMLNYLNKLPKATKIFFTEIMVEDEYGHALKLPDVIEMWFPDCKNCQPK